MPGLLIASASSLARHHPGFGALIAALPLVSVLSMTWLWFEKPDAQLMADHIAVTFWYVLPLSPMFVLTPILLRHGPSLWWSLLAGRTVTCGLYWLMTWLGSHLA